MDLPWGRPTGLAPATFGATIRRHLFLGVVGYCRIGKDRPISLLAVAHRFSMLRPEWCQQWCQMASAAPLLRWPCCTEDISGATPRPATFQPYLGDALRLQREANGRSLSVEGSSISLLDSSEFGSIPGIDSPTHAGNHPRPPRIVVPLE